MRFLRNRAVGVTAAVFGLAALLGGSLGMAYAGTRPFDLEAGTNFIGGPRQNIEPDVFLSCLPDSSWEAMYIWRADLQEWEHHYNTTKGVPGYVNLPEVGGIETVRALTGVALIMDENVDNPFFIDLTSDDCP